MSESDRNRHTKMKWYNLKGNLTKLVKKKAKPETNFNVIYQLDTANKAITRPTTPISLKNYTSEENIDNLSINEPNIKIENEYDNLKPFNNVRKSNSLDNVLLSNIVQREISDDGYPEILFLRSLIPDIKKMNAEQQHEFRIRTLGIVGDILYSPHYQNPNPGPSTVASSSNSAHQNTLDDSDPGPSNVSSSSLPISTHSREIKKHQLFDDVYLTSSLFLNTENDKLPYLNLSCSEYIYGNVNRLE